MRGVNEPLWIKAVEDANLLRKMGRSASTNYRRALLNLAAAILEELGDELYYNRVRKSTVDKLRTLETLLKRNGLPSRMIERYRIIALRSMHPYEAANARDPLQGYIIGLT